MGRVVALIPAHARHEVVCLTVGSLLRLHPGEDIDVHVGVHSNYADYDPSPRLFEELEGVANIHRVDEIDWAAHEGDLMRYSTMHAKNLLNLLKAVGGSDFDRVLLLDHDLQFRGDFLSMAAAGQDLLGCLADDAPAPFEFKTGKGEAMWRAPKLSVWHLLLSRRLFDVLLTCADDAVPPKIVPPERAFRYLAKWGLDKDLPVFVDTLAEFMFRYSDDPRFRFDIRPAAAFAPAVKHFFNSSFNYGYRTRRESYSAHIESIAEEYRREFPDGLRSFSRR